MIAVMLALAAIGEPGVWIPVPRPILAFSVESSVVTERSVATSDIVAAMSQAVEGRRLLARPIEAGEIEGCRVSIPCRLERAAAMHARHLMLLYVQNGADRAKLDLELYDVAKGLAALSEGLTDAQIEEAARVRTGQSSPLSVTSTSAASVASAWIRARLEAALGGDGMEVVGPPIVVSGLPRDAVLRVPGGPESAVGADSVQLVALPPEPVEIEVEAEDYEPRRLVVQSSAAGLEVDGSLSATPVRWVRRAVFGLGAAAVVGATVSLIAAGVHAGSNKIGCIRLSSATCPDSLVGTGIDGVSPWVPASVGIGVGGLAVVSESLFRGEPEASWPGVAVGMLLAVGAGVAVSAAGGR